MRVFILLLLLCLTTISYSQTTVLIGGTSGTCGSTGNGNTCPGTVDLCGARVQSVTINVPSGSRVEYSFNQGNGCGTSTGFRYDGGESVTVSYGSTNINLFTGSGTSGSSNAEGSGCFYNNGSTVVAVTFSGYGNRLDEAYQLTYEVITGDDVCGLLPILLKSFDLFDNSNRTIINFCTSSETNNDYFTIERSTDARYFESIGEIAGAGNSSEELSYSFTDEKPMPGVNYYRIKQTDFDGKYSYSHVKSVRHESKGSVIITPKSTNGLLTVATDLDKYNVIVYNTQGQSVASYRNLSATQSINIEELRSGIYYVEIQGENTKETLKVVKY
ncbi:MAG: T9SS type A sorting domain-containing protein [Saprospiraceae bacterium]